MPLRISDTTGYASYSTAATALNWAADHGARVAHHPLELTELIPARQPQSHLIETQFFIGTQVPHALVG